MDRRRVSLFDALPAVFEALPGTRLLSVNFFVHRALGLASQPLRFPPTRRRALPRTTRCYRPPLSSQMFGQGLVNFLHRIGKIEFNADDSMLDETVGYAAAAIGVL